MRLQAIKEVQFLRVELHYSHPLSPSSLLTFTHRIRLADQFITSLPSIVCDAAPSSSTSLVVLVSTIFAYTLPLVRKGKSSVSPDDDDNLSVTLIFLKTVVL